jgi:hypothetical protein
MESETKPNKAHHENGQKEPLDPAKIAPTNLALERSWDSTITGGNQELQLNS